MNIILQYLGESIFLGIILYLLFGYLFARYINEFESRFFLDRFTICFIIFWLPIILISIWFGFKKDNNKYGDEYLNKDKFSFK